MLLLNNPDKENISLPEFTFPEIDFLQTFESENMKVN